MHGSSSASLFNSSTLRPLACASCRCIPPVDSGSTPDNSASRFAIVDLPLPISPAMVILNGITPPMHCKRLPPKTYIASPVSRQLRGLAQVLDTDQAGATRQGRCEKGMKSKGFIVTKRQRLAAITKHPTVAFGDYERRLQRMQQDDKRPQISECHAGLGHGSASRCCNLSILGKPRRNQHILTGLHRARVSPRLPHVPRRKLCRRHGEHRARRMVDDPLGRAAAEYIQDVAMACSGHTDEIDVELDCHIDDRVHHIPRPEHLTRSAARAG